MPRVHRLLFAVLAVALGGSKVAAPVRAQAGRASSPKLGVWLYRFRELDNDELLANLQRRGVDRVFLSAPRSLLAQSSDKVHGFVVKAHQAGVEVHAMTLEDPSFVLSANHPKALREVEGVLAFSREHPDSPFDGVHLDAEPHVLFEGKAERTAADWAANEAMMKQYGTLLEQTARQVRGSGLKGVSKQPLRLSAAIAWWYNECAKDGVLPSGAAKLLGKHLDFIVPMVYDGIGKTAADVIRRVDDELAEVPTMIGVARKEYANAEGLQASIEKLNERYGANPNFQGATVFEYSRWFDVPRKN